jgi:hypothetical protein
MLPAWLPVWMSFLIALKHFYQMQYKHSVTRDLSPYCIFIITSIFLFTVKLLLLLLLLLLYHSIPFLYDTSTKTAWNYEVGTAVTLNIKPCTLLWQRCLCFHLLYEQTMQWGYFLLFLFALICLTRSVIAWAMCVGTNCSSLVCSQTRVACVVASRAAVCQSSEW